MINGDETALKLTPLIASALDNPDMRPSIQRLRDQFSTVWEVSSLSLRIHMVEEGMGVTFIDRKLLEEHPSLRRLSYHGRRVLRPYRQAGRPVLPRGQAPQRQRPELYRPVPAVLEL